MKKQYKKPEIVTEVLLKDDVLTLSQENSYVKSKNIFKAVDDYSLNRILLGLGDD
jgi:hypothetical protein